MDPAALWDTDQWTGILERMPSLAERVESTPSRNDPAGAWFWFAIIGGREAGEAGETNKHERMTQATR